MSGRQHKKIRKIAKRVMKEAALRDESRIMVGRKEPFSGKVDQTRVMHDIRTIEGTTKWLKKQKKLGNLRLR